jgi:hypothetical protein
VFAKAGAIVPMGPKSGWGGMENPAELHVHVFAGADNTFTLYEDDGETNAEDCVLTTFRQTFTKNRLELAVTVVGDSEVVPPDRVLHLHFHGVQAGVSVEVGGRSIMDGLHYDEASETLSLAGIEAGSELRIVLESDALLAGRSRKKETLLHLLRFFKLHTGVRNRMADEIDAILDDPAKLAQYIIALSDSQARALFEVLCEAGLHVVTDTQSPTLVVMWNNLEQDGITYRYRDAYLHFGFLRDSNHAGGPLPHFAHFIPSVNVWRHGSYDEHVHYTQWHAQVDYFNLLTVKESHTEKIP